MPKGGGHTKGTSGSTTASTVGSLSIDVYTDFQSSGNNSPAPSALPSGDYYALAVGDRGAWDTAWGFSFVQDTNDKTKYSCVVPNLPSPSQWGLYYVSPNTTGGRINIYAGSGSELSMPFSLAVAYTVGTQNGK